MSLKNPEGKLAVWLSRHSDTTTLPKKSRNTKEEAKDCGNRRTGGMYLPSTSQKNYECATEGGITVKLDQSRSSLQFFSRSSWLATTRNCGPSGKYSSAEQKPNQTCSQLPAGIRQGKVFRGGGAIYSQGSGSPGG